METVLYIVLGVLVAAAIAAQVWMLRTTTGSLPDGRRRLAVALRWVNIAALLVVAALAVYLLVRG